LKLKLGRGGVVRRGPPGPAQAVVLQPEQGRVRDGLQPVHVRLMDPEVEVAVLRGDGPQRAAGPRS
jgi:hypothetical protein